MLFDLNPKSITPQKNVSGKETTPDENTKIVKHKLISKETNENRTLIANLQIQSIPNIINRHLLVIMTSK